MTDTMYREHACSCGIVQGPTYLLLLSRRREEMATRGHGGAVSNPLVRDPDSITRLFQRIYVRVATG